MPAGWMLFDERYVAVKAEVYECRRLIETAAQRGLELSLMEPGRFDVLIDSDQPSRLLLDCQPAGLPDFLLPRLGSHTDYWTLSIIRQLEELGVRTFNGWRGIEAVKDKLHAHQLLAASRLPTPRTMLVTDLSDVDLVERHLGFPVIVKTLSGTQGAGVCLMRDRSACEDLLMFVRASGAHEPMILQQFIHTSQGRDLRVLVVGERVLGCMQRTGGSGFKANISLGGTGERFALNDEIARLAIETTRLVGLEIAGVDLLFDGDSYVVCEANSAPGFEGFERHTGIDVATAIIDYIAEQLEEAA